MAGSPPVVTVTPPTGPQVPGAPVTFTWTAVDPDTKTVTGQWSGEDAQGNVVSGTITLAVQDTFTMKTFTLGGASLLIDNAGRKATGTIPLS